MFYQYLVGFPRVLCELGNIQEKPRGEFFAIIGFTRKLSSFRIVRLAGNAGNLRFLILFHFRPINRLSYDWFIGYECKILTSDLHSALRRWSGVAVNVCAWFQLERATVLVHAPCRRPQVQLWGAKGELTQSKGLRIQEQQKSCSSFCIKNIMLTR